MSTNPLLDFTTLPHGAPRFDLIKLEDIEPALKLALQTARKQFEKIKNESAAPTFANTIEALESVSEDLDAVSTYYFNQLSAHTNDKLQAMAPMVSSQLTEFSSDINLDEKIFARVKAVYDEHFSSGKSSLTIEQKELVKKTYLGFSRNGALLNAEQKQKLRDIDQKLSGLAPKFDDNVLKSTNSFYLHLASEDEIAGLPPSAVEAAQAAAKEKKLTGYVFTLHGPSYVAFMTYASRRDLREKLWRAFNSRAYGNENDNRELIRQTVELRDQRAKLLGYKNHADFVLQERMAASADNVKNFLEKLRSTYKPYAEKDLLALRDLAKAETGFADIQPWDVSYYSEKLKKKLYDFDEEELRPYFSLDNVIAGAFLHAEKLYDLQFVKTFAYPTYHPDVQVFEVNSKSGEFIGLLYADFFPRESKRGGAWMTTYRDQGLWKGKVELPLVGIVCNFTKPVGNKPSLLTYDEVRTLFHEFGHALHGLLSKCQYRSLGGTHVYWDFVELPSQIMENWVQEKESLDLFAAHFETGEKIPQTYIDKIKASSNYFAGYMGLRQVSLGLLDMAWSTGPQGLTSNEAVDQFEEKALANATVLPKIPHTLVSTAFSHIFSGGYSAGYYSYKWAEVLDADAFEFFKEKGLFAKEVAHKFRDQILSRGGAEHPATLYKNFRGREADPQALLRREGIGT